MLIDDKKPLQFECQRQRERKKIVKLPNSKKKKASVIAVSHLSFSEVLQIGMFVTYTYVIAGNVVTYSHQLYLFVITSYEKMRENFFGCCKIEQIFACLLA